MRLLLLLFIVSCAPLATHEQTTGSVGPTDSFIHRGTTQFNMSYKEKSTRLVKRLSGYTQLELINTCVYLFKEFYEVETLSSGETYSYINTYQISLAQIDLDKIGMRKESAGQRRQIQFISGDSTQYIVTIPYDYKENVLIPMTTLTLNKNKVHSSKVKLVPKFSIKFGDIGNAIKAKADLLKNAQRCR